MILNNPFHVLGLVANCSKREETQRGSQIKRYLEVGKPLVFQDDLYFPGCRRNAIAVDHASTRIQDARDRIGPGLFWFTRGDSIDEKGLCKLRSGDLHGALAIWLQVEGRSIALEYASSINNLGTISLLIALVDRSPGQDLFSSDSERMDHLLRGLKAKARLIGGLSGPDLSSFCASFSDEIATRDPGEIADIFAETLELFKEEAESHGLELPTLTLVSVLDSGSGSRVAALRQRFALRPRQELERAIRECASAYENEPSQALAAGRLLMKVARVQLSELTDIVSDSEFVYTSLADRVASELLSVAVQHYNHHANRDTETIRVASESLDLVKYAIDVACSSAVRARAQENLETARTIIKGHAMKRVRATLKAWIEDAMEQFDLYSSPRNKLAFVRQALGKAGSRDDSAISLLTAIRNQGVRSFGPRFRSSDEMVQCGTLVCGILVRFVVSAYNDTDQQSTAREAAHSLLAVGQCFGAVSQQRSWDGKSFPIDDQCAAFLASNSLAAMQHLARERTNRVTSQTAARSTAKGCVVTIVLFVGVIALLASVAVGFCI